MEVLLGLIDSKNPERVILNALNFLWNVGWMDVDVCLIAIELGAFLIVGRQLESPSEQVIRAALGTVWGYIEFKSEILKQASARDIAGSFTQLLPRITSGDISSLVGCIMSLSFDEEFRRPLAEGNVAPYIIDKLFARGWPLVKYLGIITLAILTLDSEHEENLLRLGVLDLVADYLASSPQEVALVNSSMRWAYIKPFFVLMKSRHAVIRQLCGLNFAALALTDYNMPLFDKEGLVSHLMAIKWNTTDDRLLGYILMTLDHIKPHVNPPSLVELCAYRMRSSSNTDHKQVELLPVDLQQRFSFTTPL